MKLYHLIWFCPLLLLLIAPPVNALQNLATPDMKAATAQAGISIALDDVKFESYDTAFTISNPDTLPGDPLQFLGFEQGHSTLRLSNSRTDVDGDGLIGCLTLDLGTIPDAANATESKPYIFLKSDDFELQYDLTINTVNVCGNDIGNISITNLSMPSFHLLLGAHGCGIDAELGAQLSIDRFSYGTDATDTLALSGITFAKSFSGSPADPTAWQASGEFTLGNIATGNPVTMDLASDNTANWQFTDNTGTSYTAPNPRAGSGFIALNIPMEGSIRVKNISFGTTDTTANNFGSFALDNIQAHKLYIEIPGRGLGATYK